MTVLTTEFWIHNSIVRALAGPNPPPVNVDVALQKNYQLSLDGPLQVQLSDEDLEWGAGDPDNYHCMPCFRVGLPAAALGTHQLRVTWTGGGPLWFGLTAANANYDAVKLGEGTSSAGGSVIIADLPASWSSYWYHGVFVGLPKRGSLPDAITVELALVPATW